MEISIYWRAAMALWIVWVTTWWIAALWKGRAGLRAPRKTWRGPMLLAVAGMYLLFWQSPRLPAPLWHAGPWLGWAMVAMTAASFAFAWWARLTMGRMWSGGVEVSDGHEVIQRGPFAWVRHPIYTALIGAGLALAVIIGTPTALAGAVLSAAGWYLKARVEERFLTEELSGYPEYRARVPMLVPLARF